jgi:hypothetical protein
LDLSRSRFSVQSREPEAGAEEEAGEVMQHPLPISNYALGISIIVIGLLFFLKEGPAYSVKHRSEYPSKVVGVVLLASGLWVVLKEFRRRRRDGY